MRSNPLQKNLNQVLNQLSRADGNPLETECSLRFKHDECYAAFLGTTHIEKQALKNAKKALVCLWQSPLHRVIYGVKIHTSRFIINKGIFYLETWPVSQSDLTEWPHKENVAFYSGSNCEVLLTKDCLYCTH